MSYTNTILVIRAAMLAVSKYVRLPACVRNGTVKQHTK